MINKDLSPKFVVLTLKFIRQKYVKDFESGNLFFSPLSKFIQIEKNIGIAKWGDINEGEFYWRINPLKYRPALYNGNKRIGDIDPLSIKNPKIDRTLSKYYKNNIGIVSFTSITINDIEKIGNDKYKIKNEVIKDLEKMVNDGKEKRIPFIIFDNNGLKNSFLNEGLLFGPVIYYDPLEYPGDTIYSTMMYSSQIKLAFSKTKKFEYQREMRVITWLPYGNNIHIPFIESNAYKIHFKDLKNLVFKYK